MFAEIILFILIVLTLYKTTRIKENYPKGPPRLPIFGNLFALDQKFPTLSFHKWNKQYGNIYSVKFGATDMIVLNSPELIKKAFSSADFLNRPSDFAFSYFNNKRNVGLLTSWGNQWQIHRRFTLRNLRDFGFGKASVEDIVKTELLHQIDNIRNKEGQALDFSWDFNVGITNVIWTITAGHRFDPDSKEMHEIHRVVRELTLAAPKMIMYDVFPFLLWLPEKLNGVYPMRKITDMFINFFEDEIKEHQNTYKEGEPHRDLIDVYLQKFRDDNIQPGKQWDLEFFNLVRVISDLFIAGGETTYTTLRWAFLFIVMHPEIQKKLQKELDEKIGRNRLPTLDDRGKLPYLEAFIFETQRISNIVPLGAPHATVKDLEFEGYHIPKGTTVISNIYAVHMNSALWKNPEKFQPERFLNEKGELVKSDFLMPFATGKRQCIGESLAKTELFLYVSCLLHQFSFEVAGKASDLTQDALGEGFVRYPMDYFMYAKARK